MLKSGINDTRVLTREERAILAECKGLYIATLHLYHCYNDPVRLADFDRGMDVFNVPRTVLANTPVLTYSNKNIATLVVRSLPDNNAKVLELAEEAV